LAGKTDCKRDLLQSFSLPPDAEAEPVVGMVSRLAGQKGFDLLADIIDDLCSMNIAFVLLGTGEEKLHIIFQDIAKKHKKNTSINLRFDSALAQKIYAASDMFLMPSRYEPCGLGQLISFKYATVPIVRKTGGLADTVFEYKPETEDGNGFVFERSESGEFFDAIKRALDIYKNKDKWTRLITKISKYDFSWNASAKEYINLYEKALNAVGTRS